jgi:hypothetical protein
MEMTSEQHWDDLHNGVSVEEREAIVEEERRVRAVARAEVELHLAEEVRRLPRRRELKTKLNNRKRWTLPSREAKIPSHHLRSQK